MIETPEKELEKEAERKFLALYRVCRLYKDGKLDDGAVIHFLAGFCGFVPPNGDFSKY